MAELHVGDAERAYDDGMTGSGHSEASEDANVAAPSSQTDPALTERLFQARLAEHVSARDEMISSISNQHLALTFGTASIVGVFVAGFLTWKQPANPAVFFAIPLLSAWVLAMWVAEVVRMLRAVEFCREQACIINESIHAPGLRWEASRDRAAWRTITWTYISVPTVLSLSYLAGLALGLVTIRLPVLPTVGIAVTSVLMLAAVLGASFWIFLKWIDPPSRVGMPDVLPALVRKRTSQGTVEHPPDTPGTSAPKS